MRCYDWIAAPGTDPATLPALIEAAVPGLKLACTTLTDPQNGFLLTAKLPDGSLYVSVCLHNAACVAGDPTCTTEHGAHDIEIAPTLDVTLEATLPVKEDPTKVLRKATAAALLRPVFGSDDPMRRNR